MNGKKNSLEYLMSPEARKMPYKDFMKAHEELGKKLQVSTESLKAPSDKRSEKQF